MKPWVIWYINHRLRYLIYFIAIAAFPLYLLSYAEEALYDWKRDYRAIKEHP